MDLPVCYLTAFYVDSLAKKCPSDVNEALSAQFLQITLDLIQQAASELIDRTPSDLALIIQTSDGAAGSKDSISNGAAAFVELLAELKQAPPGAGRDTSRLACAVYGLWIFEGIRTWLADTSKWDDFEDDVLGEIQKQLKGRKSTITKCALHPLQMVSKYGLGP